MKRLLRGVVARCAATKAAAAEGTATNLFALVSRTHSGGLGVSILPNRLYNDLYKPGRAERVRRTSSRDEATRGREG